MVSQSQFLALKSLLLVGYGGQYFYRSFSSLICTAFIRDMQLLATVVILIL